jgi:rhamnogalacturonyl hydrolase YesR
MRKFKFLLVLLLLNFFKGFGKEEKSVLSIANAALSKGLKLVDLGTYPGSLLIHGMSELTTANKDEVIQKQLYEYLKMYGDGKMSSKGNFISYEFGGTGAAYTFYKKRDELLRKQIETGADKMFKEQWRSSEGLMTSNGFKGDSLDRVFIDVAFAVTPFLLYSGLSLNKPEYVDFAVFETLELFKILKDSNGLVHQGRGFQGKGIISEDNWSRGNGWGAYALAILVRDLPSSHPKKKEVEELAKSYFSAILKYQNLEGLWNQEMTDNTSFVETSGSGLMLYGLGIAIEKGIISRSKMASFIKGLSAYTSYIAEEGSISHTSYGCLCPRKGRKEDYVNHTWILNDPHAFGPVVLAFSQAYKMGVTFISPMNKMGIYIPSDTINTLPKATVSYMPQRKQEIIWENDRIAFRFYGASARNEVGSGIDVWAKSVEYPIMEKWYSQNDKGISYHVDHGEGADFYQVGFSRGCGGTAIWYNDKPYVSTTYSSHRIIKNTKDEVIFELVFDPWQIDGFSVSETKTVKMKQGSNFFEVTSEFKTDNNSQLTLAIGLASFGSPEILTNKINGTLTLWESYLNFGELGTTIGLDPSKLIGYRSVEKDYYLLTKVNPGNKITYKVGAGWSKSSHIKSKKDWIDYITNYFKN